MSWWLIGVLGYLGALGFVLALAGGVRRGDEHAARVLREAGAANREPENRDLRIRAAAPPRASAVPMREARRAARS